MSAFNEERVLSVHHWNDSLFSFTTTRNAAFRFRNGHFVMMGLEVEGRPLLRAFSLAGANYDEHLEFYSIKIPDGALTSRLQHVEPGQRVLVGRKPTGTLLVENLRPGKRLYLLATGTGLAPFLSIIRDPATYERYEKVVIAHGVRRVSDLAYRSFIEDELPHHELVGEQVQRAAALLPHGDPRAVPEPGPHQRPRRGRQARPRPLAPRRRRRARSLHALRQPGDAEGSRRRPRGEGLRRGQQRPARLVRHRAGVRREVERAPTQGLLAGASSAPALTLCKRRKWGASFRTPRRIRPALIRGRSRPHRKKNPASPPSEPPPEAQYGAYGAMLLQISPAAHSELELQRR